MDPNEALKELIRLADRIMDDHWLDAQEQEEFAAHFQALNDWIMSGGSLPTAWHLPKPVVVREPTIKGMYDSVTGRPATIFTPPENLIPAPVPPLVLPTDDPELADHLSNYGQGTVEITVDVPDDAARGVVEECVAETWRTHEQGEARTPEGYAADVERRMATLQGPGDKPVTQPIAYYLRLAERITHDRNSGIVTVTYAELRDAVNYLDRLVGEKWTGELHPAYDQIVAELAVRDHAAALDHPQHRKPERPDLAGNWFDHIEQGGA